ncbi:MAG: transcription antitermination factor NusB [Bacteroidales bacterium]|nr:transcription antitermination factor NusB [Bacteroidales bacterium]
MISRRLIRIKALQILYAYSKKGDVSSLNAEKELFHSIEKYYDLYLMLLALPQEIAALERKKILQRRQKRFATPEELNPNLNFQDNQFIEKLSNSYELADLLEKRKLNWKAYPDFIKQIYAAFIKSDVYADMMKASGNDFNEDKELLIRFYTEFLVNDENLQEFLEEESIYWNDDFSFVMIMLMKSLERVNQQGRIKLLPVFKNEDDHDFARFLLRKTIVNAEEYLKIIEKHTKNWDPDRIAQTDRMILQLAIAEVLEFSSIPVKVTLNEYIEIAKYYRTEKSKTFINGLLDQIIKSLSKENKIKKTGRGLVG